MYEHLHLVAIVTMLISFLVMMYVLQRAMLKKGNNNYSSREIKRNDRL